MKAVNLIPADQRRSSSAAGKSGGAVYVLLGGLAIVVAMVAALTLTNRSIADNTAKADALDAQAQVATAKVGNLAAYKQFNEVVKTRATGVKTLAATRIDWGETFEQVSRVVPADVSLTQLVASTAPGQGGGSVSLRSALSNPAIEIVGCAPSQSRVALLMARLRRLEGVQRVSVASSGKQDGSASASKSDSGDSGSGGCQIDDQIPQFQMVVFFGTPQASAASTTASGIQGAIKTLNEGTAGTTATPAPRPRVPDMSNRDRILIGVMACLVAVAGFWFLALKPKRAEATAAAARVAEAQTKLDTANQALASATSARASFETDYATAARLGKAVPDDDDAASLVFQLESAARKAGIDFRSLTVGGASSGPTATTTPAQPVLVLVLVEQVLVGHVDDAVGDAATTGTTGARPATTGSTGLPPGVVAGSNGMNNLPFTFVFDGDYFSLSKLLDLVRSFTTTNGDTVTVRGRLMTVESVNLQEGRNGFPDVKATVTATAYLAAQPISLPGGATAPSPTGGTTPSTTTAPSNQAAGGKSSLPTATAGVVR